MFDWLKKLVIGKGKNPVDPAVFHQLSLIAIFAWVGLGADGLSSSCYGPEEGYLALGENKHLALFLALLVGLTVILLSASYYQIIKLFPVGGGGYNVSSTLLGPIPGLLCGCALIVDYVLTVAISVVAGIEAIFSFLPSYLLAYKMISACAIVLILMLLNWRGVRESVLVLLPIFIVFIISHFVIVVWIFVSNGHKLPQAVEDSIVKSASTIQTLGFGVFAIAILKAYAIGGGSFTGIEALSNSVQILREPRVKTARHTMIMMAVSLALLASGLLIGYLLLDVKSEHGRTLNAVLLEKVVGTGDAGRVFVIVALISAGALLFVAAQSGFIGGPRTLATMTHNKWVPSRFGYLSSRLVVADGVTLMGLAAITSIIFTGGNIKILVVLYSISVFFTFVLSQLGMVRFWLGRGRTQNGSWWKFGVTALGFLISLVLLISLFVLKFAEGSFASAVVILALMVVCLIIRAHYGWTARLLKRLDDLAVQFPAPKDASEPASYDPQQPTAVILVSGFNGLGLHTLFSIHRMNPYFYKNFVFVSVGLVDFDHFKGPEEVQTLRAETRRNLEKYLPYAKQLGGHAEAFYTVGTDIAQGAELVSGEIIQKYPRSVFFAGQLVFAKETMWTRMLHSYIAYEIQRRLHYRGVTVVILPIAIRK